MNLKGTTALVTGGAHRVGRALTLALAEAGCNLILHYNRSAEHAQHTATEARKTGSEVLLRQADLADVDAIRALFSALPPAWQPVQVLVNSAAIFPKDTLLGVDLAGWSRTFRVNLRGPVFLTQAFARALPSESEGVVVNISDWRSERPYPDHFSYTIAKGALDTFTRAAALSLAPNIRVNAIALGAMLSPPGEDESYVRALAEDLPLGRPGGVEVIAQTLIYLLQSHFITGEIIRLDGGAHLQYPSR